MVIEESWSKLREGAVKKGMSAVEINNLRLGYIAGVYMAANAIAKENAGAVEVNNAAYRIELGSAG